MAGTPQTLGESVGRGGANDPGDQRTVAKLLQSIDALNQGGHDGVILISPIRGLPNSELNTAIERFQRRHFPGVPDVRVDPNGKTLRKMNELARPAPPVGPQPKTIRDKVGRPPALNSPSDAEIVTDLLMRVLASDGGPDEPIFPAPFPGTASPSLVVAIEKFQRRQFAQADGRVDPGGRTLDKLNKLTNHGTGPKKSLSAFVSAIRAPVGRPPAVNNFDDQIKLIALLSQVAASDGGPGRIIVPPVLPGTVSSDMIAAIEVFQRRQFGATDGRIDPGAKSELRMCALVKPRF